jgi:hypothetical protein
MNSEYVSPFQALKRDMMNITLNALSVAFVGAAVAFVVAVVAQSQVVTFDVPGEWYSLTLTLDMDGTANNPPTLIYPDPEPTPTPGE